MKAVILFSGGVDSTVLLARALAHDKECLALSFDYGQRHKVELQYAAKIAHHYSVRHQIITIDTPSFDSSSLVNPCSKVAVNRTAQEIARAGIPSTYVPARNTIFLAYAMGFAEMYQASEIHFGANIMDTLPYPDCRPEYLNAFQQLLNVATKQAVEGHAPKLVTPLIAWDKARIIQEGLALNAPLDMTFSCYSPLASHAACGCCDACMLRKAGFAAANM